MSSPLSSNQTFHLGGPNLDAEAMLADSAEAFGLRSVKKADEDVRSQRFASSKSGITVDAVSWRTDLALRSDHLCMSGEHALDRAEYKL